MFLLGRFNADDAAGGGAGGAAAVSAAAAAAASAAAAAAAAAAATDAAAAAAAAGGTAISSIVRLIGSKEKRAQFRIRIGGNVVIPRCLNAKDKKYKKLGWGISIYIFV